MSVRFFKILSGVIAAHLLGLTFVWVGFFTPLSRLPAAFTYQGALPAQETEGAQEAWPKEKLNVLGIGRAQVNHWITLRSLRKPSNHAYLGF